MHTRLPSKLVSVYAPPLPIFGSSGRWLLRNSCGAPTPTTECNSFIAKFYVPLSQFQSLGCLGGKKILRLQGPSMSLMVDLEKAPQLLSAFRDRYSSIETVSLANSLYSIRISIRLTKFWTYNYYTL